MWGRITGQLVRRLAPSLRLSSPREAQHRQLRLSWEPPPPPQLPCPAASSRYHPGRTWSTPWDCQHSAVSTLSSPDGQLQRRHVLVVDLVDVCSPLQQDLDNLLPPTADSVVEWCGVPGPTSVRSHKYWARELWLPRVTFLVDVLPEVEPDEDLLHIAGHGGVIEVERHSTSSRAVLCCQSGCLTVSESQ